MLWLEKYRKDLKTPIDEVMQNRFDEGYDIEAQAEKLFPGGVSCLAEGFPEQLEKTRQLIAAGEKYLFQPSFSVDNLWYRGDILVRDGAGWQIYEVKSSTKAKPVHFHDLAFQKYTMEKAGHRVTGTNLILVNNEYVKEGEIDPTKLLYIQNVDDEVNLWMDLMPDYINQAKKVLEAKEEWPVKILKQCDDPYECGFKAHCWRDFPDESIYQIVKHIPDDLLSELVEENRLRLEDLPKIEFSRQQMNRWQEAFRQKQPIIYPDKIKHEFDQLQYPLYFFDYETYGPGVPMMDGYRPYQHMPFQYSVHILEKPGADFVHREYLAKSMAEVGRTLLEQLTKDVGPTGSIIAWNKSFEMGRNDEMSVLHPDFAKYLVEFNRRVFDLMDIFKNGYYVDSHFYGSSSIKAVLPVMVPELSYKDLSIGGGELAMVMWKRMIAGESDTEKIFNDLLQYCQQDTWGMVRIWQELNKIL